MKRSLLTLSLLLLFAVSETMAGVLRVGSWSSSGSEPHSTLTSALHAAEAGDEIWVISNTYREAEFMIPAGVSVYGGFTGSETRLSERDYATNVTILDGSGAHRVATVSGLLDGFTLRNGRTGDNGGGVLVKSGGTLSHCIAFANEAGYDGGGVFAEEGATVTNTLSANNRAGNDGAGVSGTRGYRAVNLTAVDNNFTNKPEIKKALVAPALLNPGEVLNVTEPDILNVAEVDPHGSTVLMKGWELDGHAIAMPYTVTYADNGKKLRFWAANAIGVGVSNEVALTVTWTVTSSAQLLTPKAVCEGTTLAGAGIGNPAFSPIPEGGATYTYYIDNVAIPAGLNYQLQYSDNGKLLTCEIKNTDGSISGATTPAVRLAVMKAPEVLLANVPALSIEEGQPLCLPTPVVISNGSDVTVQGWKWTTDGGVTVHGFNSCDKANTAMNKADIYYMAENGCSAAPAEIHYTTLTVTNPVGEFLQTVSALCADMKIEDAINFDDGGNPGDYYIGNTYIGKADAEGDFTTSWDDVKSQILLTTHNLQTLRFSYNGGKSERRLTLTVHPVPEITTDPVTPANALCLGDAHTLIVEATGDNLAYQWERSIKSEDGSEGAWSSVPGSTTAACRLTADVSAYYRCTVTGVCIDKSAGVSGGKITSASAELTVNDRPVIPDVTFIPSDLNICAGVEISTILTGKAPTLGGTAALNEGWTLGGVKIADNYKVLSTDNGKVLGYWASNACGERTFTFSTGILAVASRPEVLQSPADVSAVEDSRVRLSVSASGSNLTYQWQQKAHADDDTDDNWHDIAGETNPAYSFTAANITAGAFDGDDVLTDYRCVVGTTNACSATTVKSALATVTVTRNKSAVSIRRQPAAYEVCSSEPSPYAPGFTVEVEGSGHFTYKWYDVNDDINPVNADATTVVEDKTNTFKPTTAGTYYCVITSTDDAIGTQTQAVMLTVSQAPAINSITPASATICEGGSVTLGVDATGSALTYQWYQQKGATPVPATDDKKGTAPTYTPVGLTTTTTFYCVVGSGSVCTATVISDPVAVTIESAPKITTQPLSQSVCGSTGVTLSVVAANTDTYQWYYNGTTTGGNSAILANVTAGGVYTCVVSKSRGVCGEATSVPALITVAAEPKVNLGTRNNLIACQGDLITLPSPEVETGGSVIVTEKTGWYKSTETPATATLVSSYAAGNANETWHYKLTYKCSAGGSETLLTKDNGMPTLTVSVTPAPTVAGTLKDVTKNAGESVTEAEVVNNLTTTNGTTQWLLGGTPVTLPLTTTSADDGKLFSCVVTNACGAKATLSQATGKLTVNSLVITTQPVSQAYCEGVSGKTLSVVTNITPTSYQWYKDGVALTVAGDITNGSQTATLKLGSATTDAGVYTCEVKLGTLTVVSSPAVVTIHAKPSVVSNSQNVTVCSGTPVTLQVEAKGHDLKYSWNQGIGSTSSAVTVTPAATTTYTCTVKNSCDNVGKTSDIMVTVNAPVAITTQPKDQNECSYAALNVAATGTAAISYKWSKDGTVIGSATAASYTPSAEGVYTCEVSNACGSVTSAPAVVKKKVATVIATQPADATICRGESVSLGVKAMGDDLTYQWYSGTTNTAVTTVISGATSATLSVSPSVNTYYKCMVSGCTSVTSNVVLVTVRPVTAITALGGQPLGKVCNTATMPMLTVTATGDGTLSYQWYKDGAAISGATGVSYAVKNTDLGAHNYEVKVTGNCGSLLSQAAVVELVKAPEVQLPTDGITACTGDVLTLPVPSIEPNGSVIDKANTGWCLSLNETLVNSWKVTGTSATSWRYKVRYTCGTSAAASVFSSNLTVTPNEAPTITQHPKDEVKCGTDAFSNLSVTATGTAPSYQWYKDNATQSGATGSTYAVGQNAGVYHCVVSNACGTATSAPATLTRNAALAATAYADKSALCGSEATVVGVKVTAGAPMAYQWDKGGTTMTNATLPNMAVVGEDGTAVATRTYSCTVTDICGKTVKPSVTVTHNPVPKITAQPVGGDVCDATKALGVTATGAKSYQWYKDGASISGATSASYTVPNAVGSYSYYCMVASENCGNVASASVQVNIEQPPVFASSTDLSTTYAGVGGDQIVLPAIPDYTPNGSTVTGGRWVYGSSNAVLGSTWQSAYNNQPLYYQISYKGVCNASGTTLRSPQQGTLKWANFFSNDVPSSLIAGKFYTMMDTRDLKIYRIKRLSNNQVWMVQNLDYGTCSGAYNSSNSQGNVQGITGAGGELLYGVCRSSADYSSAPKDNGATYKYYNWQGAMQDEGAVYNNSTNKPEWSANWQGICPNGWHLPTKDEMQTMYNAVGSYAYLTFTADNNTSSWAGVSSGNVGSSGSFLNATIWGYCVSSTYFDTYNAYCLSFGSGGSVKPSGSSSKRDGLAVRCLKN